MKSKRKTYLNGPPMNSGSDFIVIDINFKNKFIRDQARYSIQDIVKFNEESESVKKKLKKRLFRPLSAFFFDMS